MIETYRCLYCNVSLDGPDAWIEHINTAAHRKALLGPALQQDPDDERDDDYSVGGGYIWSAPHRQHDND